MIRKLSAVFLALALIFMVVPLEVQGSNIQTAVSTVSLSFTAAESLSLSVTPASLTFNSAGVAPALSVTTTWNVAAGAHNAWRTFLYFSSGNALTVGSNNIATSAINAAIAGGASGACNGSGTVTINSHVYTNPITVTNNCPMISYLNHVTDDVFSAPIPLNSSQTDSVVLSITNPGSFNAGAYTGTLNAISVVQ